MHNRAQQGLKPMRRLIMQCVSGWCQHCLRIVCNPAPQCCSQTACGMVYGGCGQDAVGATPSSLSLYGREGHASLPALVSHQKGEALNAVPRCCCFPLPCCCPFIADGSWTVPQATCPVSAASCLLPCNVSNRKTVIQVSGLCVSDRQ
jgi:hypothetical protein